MSDEKSCPDCKQEDGTHSAECHVGWAASLADVPVSTLKRNPYHAFIKEASRELPTVDGNDA